MTLLEYSPVGVVAINFTNPNLSSGTTVFVVKKKLSNPKKSYLLPKAKTDTLAGGNLGINAVALASYSIQHKTNFGPNLINPRKKTLPDQSFRNL